MECQPDLQGMATEARRETGAEGAQEGNRPLMTDTTPIVDTIRHLIGTGTTEEQIVATLVQAYPELTLAELSEALQEATEAAERHTVEVARRH
jgi:uncharacterized protein (DUF433 family)